MEEEPGIWLGEVASCVEVHVALALVSRRFSLVQVASGGGVAQCRRPEASLAAEGGAAQGASWPAPSPECEEGWAGS